MQNDMLCGSDFYNVKPRDCRNRKEVLSYLESKGFPVPDDERLCTFYVFASDKYFVAYDMSYYVDGLFYHYISDPMIGHAMMTCKKSDSTRRYPLVYRKKLPLLDYGNTLGSKNG